MTSLGSSLSPLDSSSLSSLLTSLTVIHWLSRKSWPKSKSKPWNELIVVCVSAHHCTPVSTLSLSLRAHYWSEINIFMICQNRVHFSLKRILKSYIIQIINIRSKINFKDLLKIEFIRRLVSCNVGISRFMWSSISKLTLNRLSRLRLT